MLFVGSSTNRNGTQTHFPRKLHAQVAKSAHALDGNVSPARAALRSALKVVMPAHTSGAASSDLSSSGMRAKRACLRNHRFRVATVSVMPVIIAFLAVCGFTAATGLAGSVFTSEKSNSTRWPTFQAVTPVPTSSIRPMTRGQEHADRKGWGIVLPPLLHPNGITPQASTRIRTCPAPGTASFLWTKEKTPGEEISTAL